MAAAHATDRGGERSVEVGTGEGASEISAHSWYRWCDGPRGRWRGKEARMQRDRRRRCCAVGQDLILGLGCRVLLLVSIDRWRGLREVQRRRRYTLSP